METLPWYRSAIVRQQIVAFIVAVLGFAKVKYSIDLDATVATVLAGVGALIPLLTIITRIFKPAPFMSYAAAFKERELVMAGKIPAPRTYQPLDKFVVGSGPLTRDHQNVGSAKQRGRAEVGLLMSISICCALALAYSGIFGCVGTQGAYKAAPLHGEALADTAYVIAEHYSAVVKQAADLAESHQVSPTIIVGMQVADRRVKRLILGDPANATIGLRQLEQLYTATHDPKTEAQLQQAVNDAAVALADFINAVKTAGGK